MSSWRTKENAYILGWCVYHLQGTLYPVGSIFSQLILAVLLISSLYYCFIANVRYKLPIYFLGLNLLLAMFTIYGIFLILTYDASEYVLRLPRFIYLKSVWISLLPIYPFYVFFKEKKINEKNIYVWILVFFIVATANYYENHRIQLLAALLNKSDADEFTNNVGYEFLALIPACVLLYKKPIVQHLALGYCIVFMLMAMKRGAIIIGTFILIWFIWNNLKKATPKLRVLIIILSLLLCFIGYKVVQIQMDESLYFQKRVEDTFEGNSSKRDKIYNLFGNYYWNEATPFQFVFGSGANATLKMYDFAHNDWLEIAVNQGILGLFIYLIYWFCFVKFMMSMKYGCRAKLAVQLIFIIYFMKTFFSMSYGSMTIGATFIFGYCLAQENNNEQIEYCD